MANGTIRIQYPAMPRIQRLCVPGIPLHIVQRGNNKQPCFHGTPDNIAYLEALKNAASHYGVDVHAYVLMTNHVHLLVTPHDRSSASRMMQHLGRNYVQRFNAIHKRTGTLWEGRFRSSIIESDGYLLTCYRYIELNPVRANLVKLPAEYRWSSFKTNALGKPDDIITPHQQWLNLGITMGERCRKFRRLFDDCSIHDDFEAIRSAVRKGLPTGSASFRKNVEATLNIRIGSGRRGRPSKRKGL